MRKKIAAVAMAGGLGLTGGMLIAPSVAAAAEDGPAGGAVGSRLSAIKDALAGLVADKTLTQTQADKVAATLDQRLPRRGPGFGGRGAHAHLHPAAVAKVLGITEAELRTQLEAGRTLAQIAQAEGMGRSELIAGLVKAAEAALAQAVEDGRLTQAQADQARSTLTARITEKVDRVGFGRRGHRHGPPPADTGSTATPSSTATA